MSIFNQIKREKPKTNVFDMSHDHKLSFDMGELIPFMYMETLPGDVVNLSTQTLLRFAPMIAPVMHKVDVYTHFFYVPNRVLWDGWGDFISNAENPQNQPPAPYFSGGQVVAKGSVADYLGMQIGETPAGGTNALPFAAYNMIYNEYFRDQNLVPEVATKLTDGQNGFAAYNQIRRRAWQHDYYTSALPWAQKGAAVTIPIDAAGGGIVTRNNSANPGRFYTTDGSNVPAGNNPLLSQGGAGTQNFVTANDGSKFLAYDPMGTLEVGNFTANGGTINDLRRAFSIQRFLEKQARGGSRLSETILAHFGVQTSDARLGRPEYLGGNREPMVISEVLQTSESTETPQGNMAGHGISVGQNKAFRYRCEEHGFVMGIMSVMPRTAYQQGIPRVLGKRLDPFDYAWPDFAHLGEQPIENQEIFYRNEPSTDKATFGYTPRYQEYRFMENRVSGEFRNDLSYWHLGRIFNTAPALNQQFIECNPDKRIFAVQEAQFDSIYCHAYSNMSVVRRLPKYGTPI